MQARHINKSRVYVEDTDFGGIVYHAQYLKFIERARTDYLCTHGITLAECEKNGFYFIVHRLKIQYDRALQLNETYEATVLDIEMHNSSMTFRQNVRDTQDQDCIYCSADVKIVCVSKDEWRPIRVPKTIRELLA